MAIHEYQHSVNLDFYNSFLVHYLTQYFYPCSFFGFSKVPI